MPSPDEPLPDRYESLYRHFDAPVMRQLRRDAYGEDIGQHSWVSAEELRADIQRLQLDESSRLLDLGCGPCGPLTFMLATTGCRGTGVERSRSALHVGRARAASLGIDDLLEVREADLDAPLPLEPRSYDAAISLDVVLHLRDRLQLFREVARLLRPGGRFLFTDAGVLTGSISNDEVRRRSSLGFTQFVSPGWNEALLETAGLRLIETGNRTASVIENAGGRLAAMREHREELESVLGAHALTSQQEYLDTVVELSRRGALSRIMYLAELSLPFPG
jgi:SAM-dependent methyltransferase